jgi:hypothetical protein
MFIWPKRGDNALSIIAEKMFAAKCINPRGVLEKTVGFAPFLLASSQNRYCFIEWNLFRRHFIVVSSSTIGSRFIFQRQKSFSQPVDGLD